MRFATDPARRFMDGRTIVLILSDGYNSDGPEAVAAARARLRRQRPSRRSPRWTAGWRGYDAFAV